MLPFLSNCLQLVNFLEALHENQVGSSVVGNYASGLQLRAVDVVNSASKS